MRMPHRKSDALRTRDDGLVYLTEDGLRKLKEKLARLKSLLPDLIAETARTAAYGDRSENAEYKEAKSILRRTHGQIWSIEDRLKRVEIIAEGRNKSGFVELGSTVVLETNRKRKTFQIVGPHETNPDNGRISHVSPLGAALMHRKKGDAIAVRTERGIQEYRIIEIK